MDNSRRNFIKLAGGAVALAAGIKAADKAEASSGSQGARAMGKSGKRYAMVVDLTKYEGDPQQYTIACHSAHNVPDFGNPKDEVKWIWNEPFANAFPTVAHQYSGGSVKGKKTIVLCNHCDKPPCVKACPTQATFQRKDGVVAMDFHRCIGCRFCVSACPYGARSLNFRDPRPFIKKINNEFPTRTRGVVEKCNFCSERLAEGKQPACVEACTDGTLTFGDLNDPHSEVRVLLDQHFTIRRKLSLGTEPMVFYIV